MQAWLCAQGTWRLVSGMQLRPTAAPLSSSSSFYQSRNTRYINQGKYNLLLIDALLTHSSLRSSSFISDFFVKMVQASFLDYIIKKNFLSQDFNFVNTDARTLVAADLADKLEVHATFVLGVGWMRSVILILVRL